MKKSFSAIVLAAFFCFMNIAVTAQITHQKTTSKAAHKPAVGLAKASKTASKPMMYVEIMPAFKGVLNTWLAGNIHYPDSARLANAEGRSIVKFVIDEEGRVTDAEIVRSSGNHFLDEEAVRVVSIMPDWTPGMQEGKKVKVYYTLPMNFKLDN